MFDTKGELKVYSKIICKALRDNDNYVVMSLFEHVNISKVRDGYYRTLLHISAASGNIDITKYLIKSQCNVDAIDEDGNTPLLLAVYFHHLEVVKLLLNVGADVCIANSNGRTPIFYAKVNENRCILKALLLALKNNQGDKTEVFNLLMSAKQLESNLNHAKTLHCNEKLFYSIMLQQSPLYNDYQIFKGYNLIELPLNKAVFLKDMHQIRMSLKYGVNPMEEDGNGCTALHAAATFMNDGNEFIQMILDHGGMINVRDKRGITPLHVASAFCNVNFMRLLLKRGADVHTQDIYGRTPLYTVFTDSHRIAIKRNKAMRILLQYGADINIKPCDQPTILERTLVLQDLISRNFILKYLARMTSQGSHVADYYLEVIQKFKDVQIYYKECQEELNFMMQMKVIGAISFFNVLKDNTSTIASFARNKNFIQSFQAVNLEKTFPFYHKYLRIRFDIGVERMKLMENGAVVLTNTVPFLSPNHLVIQKILNYLKTNDLRKLCT